VTLIKFPTLGPVYSVFLRLSHSRLNSKSPFLRRKKAFQIQILRISFLRYKNSVFKINHFSDIVELQYAFNIFTHLKKKKICHFWRFDYFKNLPKCYFYHCTDFAILPIYLLFFRLFVFPICLVQYPKILISTISGVSNSKWLAGCMRLKVRSRGPHGNRKFWIMC